MFDTTVLVERWDHASGGTDMQPVRVVTNADLVELSRREREGRTPAASIAPAVVINDPGLSG